MAADGAGRRARATDRQRGAILARWCETATRRRDMLDEYIGAFLTEQGEIRQVLITKAAAPKLRRPTRCAVLQAEAERVLRFQAERAGSALVEATLRAGAARRRAAATPMSGASGCRACSITTISC